MKNLNINLIYIENTFIYKIKDLLKNKNSKHIINFNDIADFSVERFDINTKKLLIGSLIIKKINKLLIKLNAESEITIYYVLNELSDDVINNIGKNISTIFDGNILFNLYTDSKDVNITKKIQINKLTDLKQ